MKKKKMNKECECEYEHECKCECECEKSHDEKKDREIAQNRQHDKLYNNNNTGEYQSNW